MKLFLIFFTSLFIALSGAVVPGPLLVITADEAVKRGRKVGFIISSAHSLLEFFLIILFLLGFSDFLKKEIVFRILSFVGGTFLIFMGISMLWEKEKKKELKIKNGTTFLKGIFATLGNPYWYLWWVSVGISYLVIASPYGFLGIFLFFTGHILGDFLWYCFVSFYVEKKKEGIFSEKYFIFSRIMGIFLAGLGIWFFSFPFTRI